MLAPSCGKQCFPNHPDGGSWQRVCDQDLLSRVGSAPHMKRGGDRAHPSSASVYALPNQSSDSMRLAPHGFPSPSCFSLSGRCLPTARSCFSVVCLSRAECKSFVACAFHVTGQHNTRITPLSDIHFVLARPRQLKQRPSAHRLTFEPCVSPRNCSSAPSVC